MIAAMGDKFVFGNRLTGFEDNDSPANLTPPFIRHADDRRLGHLRQLVEHVLHLGRVNVLTARDEHILPPVDDVVVAILVAHGHVAGVQPAVFDGLSRHLRQAPVAGRHAGTFDQQFATFPGGQVVPGAVNDAHIYVHLRLAD